MSNKAIDAVKHCSQSKGGLRLLLVMIADGVSKDTDVYDAKIETLMADTNYDRRFVQRLINRGIALGELVTYPRGNRNSAFQIPMLAGEPGYDPHECPDYQRWQDGEEPAHYCNGTHTPLQVNREEEYRVLLGEKRSLRRRRASRVQRSIDRPEEEHDESATSGGGQLTAPQRTIDRPEADDRPLHSGQLTAHYPLNTLLITHDVPVATPPKTKKREQREPEPEPEPEPEAPPASAPPPPGIPDSPDIPRWVDFMRDYRHTHGIASKYSEMHAAFYAAYGMTPDAARERQKEVYA